MTKPSTISDLRTRGRAARFVWASTLLAGATMLGFGAWALLSPKSFADFIDFPPYNEHLLHDAGAFQIGLGVTLLLAALRWRDSLAVSLAGFVIAGGLHAINHLVDLPLGGHDADVWGLGGLAVLAAIALVMHLRDQRSTS